MNDLIRFEIAVIRLICPISPTTISTYVIEVNEMQTSIINEIRRGIGASTYNIGHTEQALRWPAVNFAIENKPFPVETLRGLLKQLYLPSVVLDEVVVHGKDINNCILDF
ncbi:hypothetical protein HMPREF1868_00110 [Olsenella sp. DNF00959]|nr:hypothetical protein HMPREF1868_00110 [Olsenella sp. DNF00959]